MKKSIKLTLITPNGLMLCEFEEFINRALEESEVSWVTWNLGEVKAKEMRLEFIEGEDIILEFKEIENEHLKKYKTDNRKRGWF